MATQLQSNPTPAAAGSHNGRLIGGLVLIAIGLFTLLGQFVRDDTLGLLVLPTLGLLFLSWGIGTHNAGLLIPGGVLSSLGVGVYLIERPLSYLSGPAEGGVILVSLAVGFGIITLLSALFTARLHWWPLIPASVLALVGGSLLAGSEGLRVLAFVGQVWPAVLIVAGAYLLLRPRARAEG